MAAAFVKGAIIMTTEILLLRQFCCAEILYYSKENMTFDRAIDDMSVYEFCGYALVPRFTPTGLHMLSLPDSLKQRLRLFYEHGIINTKRPELILKDDIIWRDQVQKSNNTENLLNFVDIQNDLELKRDLEAVIRLELEKWTGISGLQHSATYGIREYTRGAVLKPHVDRFGTRVVAAIINVRQQIDEPWPLVVFDHNHNRHEIYLNETVDVVLYESATIIHGRPYPLMGDSFANVFVHFFPTGWDPIANNIQNCVEQTAFICPDYGSPLCATANLGHYMTDHSFIIDVCDHDYHRAAAHLARHINLS